MDERQIIEYITALSGPKNEQLIQGIGDDCAVIQKDAHTVWLVTMDTLIESVHFDCAFHPPEKLGRKAVSVNVSDIGAMGGRPLFVLLALGMPTGFDPAWFRAFTAGLHDACCEYGCVLIGGDTVASPLGITCTLTVIGEAQPEQVVYRRGAQPGDTIWVTGPLGFAAAGLELLRRGLERDTPAFAPFREQHWNPKARVAFGQFLGASGFAHAMMDISDGLGTDLAHLCKRSAVGARLVAAELPGLADLARAADLIGFDPVQWAISGGEDYELLFTTRPDVRSQVIELGRRCGLSLSSIGTVIEGEGVSLLHYRPDGSTDETAIAYSGFDHFRI